MWADVSASNGKIRIHPTKMNICGLNGLLLLNVWKEGTQAVVVGYATGYALTRRTLPLAGAGAVEALLPFALVWVGYSLPAAVLAVFAYRVFNLWLPLGPAAVGLYHLQRRAPEAAGALAADAEVARDDGGVHPAVDARSARDGNG
jgi:hypothetical protein